MRYVQSLKIDPREETILLQVDNNSLELRDFRSGERLATWNSDPVGAGLQSAYNLDGRFVVTCKYPDPVLHLRDAKTFEDVKPLTNHLPVRWFRLTPDGRRVLAGQPLGYLTSTLEIHPARREVPFHRARAVDNVVIDRACRTKLAGEVVGDMEKLFTFWDQYGWHHVTFYGDLREPVRELAAALKFQFVEEA